MTGDSLKPFREHSDQVVGLYKQVSPVQALLYQLAFLATNRKLSRIDYQTIHEKILFVSSRSGIYSFEGLI
jgi:hypothetical protein